MPALIILPRLTEVEWAVIMCVMTLRTDLFFEIVRDVYKRQISTVLANNLVHDFINGVT